MTKSLIPYRDPMTEWESLLAFADTVFRTRMFTGPGTPQSPEQMALVMFKARELGISLTSAIELIPIVQGKLSLSPRGALALAIQTGEITAMSFVDNEDPKGNFSCTAMIERNGIIKYETTFSVEDAKRADLVKPGGAYTKYPKNMVRWRAIGYALDITFPDVQGGMRRADEFGATVDYEGNVIDVMPSAALPPAQTSTHASLEDLMAIYSAEEIMRVNNGVPPSTDEDLVRIALILEGGDAKAADDG